MDPEVVRQALAARHAQQIGKTTFRLPADGINRDDQRGGLYASISASYYMLRGGLAALAFALPILVWMIAGPGHLQGSISAYYHFSAVTPKLYGAGTSRNIFVGVLWTVGTFLVLYKGYSRAEDRVLDIAGGAAVLISLCPMDWPVCVDKPCTRSALATVHYLSATAFFLAIAYVCMFRSNDTLSILSSAARRRVYRRRYAILAVSMAALPAAILVLLKLGFATLSGYTLFAVEFAGVYVFATFWVVKSLEIREIEHPKISDD
jgi:hypothetical protein